MFTYISYSVMCTDVALKDVVLILGFVFIMLWRLSFDVYICL